MARYCDPHPQTQGSRAFRLASMLPRLQVSATLHWQPYTDSGLGMQLGGPFQVPT